jgi:hypothetical protein
MTPVLERFYNKITRIPESGCWLWDGYLCQGYGSFSLNGKQQQAHRVSYELHVGPIPEGLQIDHLCRVRCCVNPAHLEPVTQRENLLRGNTFQAAQSKRTHCPQGHPYDEKNTYRCHRGHRNCKACSLVKFRRWYYKRKLRLAEAAAKESQQ